MTTPGHVLFWGRTRIDYEVRRSARQKTVSIAVEPGGDVVVTAPREAAVERLHRLVRDKAGWIVRRRRLLETLDPAPVREFVSGETLLYRGRQHRLEVTVAAAPAAVKLEAGRLKVRVPATDAGLVRNALVAWFRVRAQDRLPRQLADCARKAGAPEVTAQVVSQQKRWASCTSAGVIRLNWRLVQAPAKLVEYVLLHELVHLEHAAHDDAFWSALGALLPDYERRKEELRRLGPRLVW